MTHTHTPAGVPFRTHEHTLVARGDSMLFARAGQTKYPDNDCLGSTRLWAGSRRPLYSLVTAHGVAFQD